MPEREAALRAVVDRDLRPKLQAHGGDLEVRLDDGGGAEVVFHGACRGCPALPTTFLGVVGPALRRAEVATEVACAQVNVSPHARRRLEQLFR